MARREQERAEMVEGIRKALVPHLASTCSDEAQEIAEGIVDSLRPAFEYAFNLGYGYAIADWENDEGGFRPKSMRGNPFAERTSA